MDRLISKMTQHFQYKIKPGDIRLDINQNILHAIVGSLNTVPEFWRHEITVDYNEEIIKNYIMNYFPKNLKASSKVDITKWKFNNKVSKVCQLANKYAEHIKDLEYKDIKAIYGDFGTGELSDEKTQKFITVYPDCPHIKKQHRVNIGGK